MAEMASFSNAMNSEKLSIKQSGNGLRRYGSTCNHIKRPEHFIIHQVQKTDTLQGLALKYNTTTELIRRANRLFASDSLFLRDTLKIPVPKEIEVTNVPTSSSDSAMVNSSSVQNASFLDDYDDDTTAMSYLFGKIDSSIAETRAQVRLSQQHSQVLNNSNGFTEDASVRKDGQWTDMTTAPQPVAFSHGRKVRSSLQRLEQEQDDLFEL